MKMESLWKMRRSLPEFPRLEQDAKTDVLIIGGGMAGLLCAHRLTELGVDCMLLERDRVGCGVTGNTTAKVTAQHGLIYGKLLREFGPDTAMAYWEANEEALERYRNLFQALGVPLEPVDSYLYSRTPSRELEQELSAMERLGIPCQWTDRVPLPFATAGAIRVEDQAQMDPYIFLEKLVPGLPVYEHTPVREFRPGAVITDRGTVRAKKIIVATHFPMLNKHGSYFLKMYQERSYVLALENAKPVEGIFRDRDPAGFSFRDAQGLLLLGGGSHRTGKPGGGWKPLEELAKSCYPKSGVKYRWATQDCVTLDGIPYIGQYSRNTPDLYVATGFNKWGMTSAMAAALVLGDLVRGVENPWSRLFSPQRTMLRPQLLANIFSSAANVLRPTVPRYPHLGCALRWNPQERSWDCPCHGSRFSPDGKLLNGPATDDKKPRNL